MNFTHRLLAGKPVLLLARSLGGNSTGSFRVAGCLVRAVSLSPEASCAQLLAAPQLRLLRVTNPGPLSSSSFSREISVRRGILGLNQRFHAAPGLFASAEDNMAAPALHLDASTGSEGILRFWFGDWVAESTQAEVDDDLKMKNIGLWFRKNEEVDSSIREAYSQLIKDGIDGKLASWEDTPRGALALTILLDQFPRNSFRGSPQTFAADHLVLEVAKRAVARGFDKELPPPMGLFFYLPYEHSEDLATVEEAVKLCANAEKNWSDGKLRNFAGSFRKFAEEHRDVIAKFGRYPHRNVVLKRESTPEEIEYIKAGGGFA